jgi:hypothetical protein
VQQSHYEENEGYFYILKVGNLTKFGITEKWTRRIIQFLTEFPDQKVGIYYLGQFERMWKVKLMESLMSITFQPVSLPKKREWIVEQMDVKKVHHVFEIIRAFVEQETQNEKNKDEYTLKNGNRRKLLKLLNALLIEKFRDQNMEVIPQTLIDEIAQKVISF